MHQLLEHRPETSARDATPSRPSEECFRSLIENALDLITMLDANGIILYESPSVEHVLGYHPEELIGRSVFELIHPDDLPAVLEGVAEALEQPNTLISAEFRMRSKDGSWRYLEVRGRNLLDDPAVRSMVVNSRDVTEHKRAREELQRQQAHLEQLFHSAPEAIVLLDNEERVLRINPEFMRMFGYTPEEVQGKLLDPLIAPEDAAEESIAFTREVKRGNLVSAESVRLRKDRTPIHVSILGTPIHIRGSHVAIYGIYRDITERKVTEEAMAQQALQLVRSNRELEQFAYVASHDLQEPLRKIQAFGDRLKSKYTDGIDAQGRDYIERMQSAAGRMQALITDLLTLSRVTTRPQPFEAVDLAVIAREVVSDLEIRIQQTGGRVQIDELPSLYADPLQIRQLLQNLIGNALKFHRDGEPPVVTVSEHTRDESPDTEAACCEIVVADNGIGFDEKYLDRIFNPFQRLHGRGEYEGTGMGLAICRKIVERHGGDITAQSTVGQGSTFRITLPVHPGAGAEAA